MNTTGDASDAAPGDGDGSESSGRQNYPILPSATAVGHIFGGLESLVFVDGEKMRRICRSTH